MRPDPATVVGVSGVLAALAVLGGTGSWRTGLRVLLDMLMAAGLLGLTGRQGWTGLAAAAAVVLLRRVLWASLSHGRRPGGPADRAPTTAPGQPAQRPGCW